MSDIVFAASAVLCVVSALAAAMNPRTPVYSVALMLPFFLGLTFIFVLLSAPFVAAMQIAIYGGAILVLFLFVVMLLNLRTEDPRREGKPGGWMLGSLLSGSLIGMLAVFGALASGGAGLPKIPTSADSGFGSVKATGEALFGPLAVPFELMSVLIVAALIGAVLLAKRDGGGRRPAGNGADAEAERWKDPC